MAKKTESIRKTTTPATPVKPVKAPAKTAPKKPATRAKAKPLVAIEEIQLRAYFISENRRNAGIPGDEAQDWIEAERQVRAELGGNSKRPSPKRKSPPKAS